MNIAARQQALALGECPFRPAEDIIREGTIAKGVGLAAVQELAVAQKPEMYARFAPYIEETLERVFERRRVSDDLGLMSVEHTADGNYYRDAEPSDAETWDGLRSCWMRTLDYDLACTLYRHRNSKAFASTRALWDIRAAASDLGRDAGTQLRAGILTVGTSTAGLAYGMSLFLEAASITGEHKKVVMRRSHGPLRDLTDLEVHQIDIFGRTYLGEHFSGTVDDATVTTHYDEIDAGLYTLLGEPQERLVYIQKPETLPAYNGQLISDVKPSLEGPRMGCPIRLTPKLTQELWGVYIDTAAEVGLLAGEPGQYLTQPT